MLSHATGARADVSEFPWRCPLSGVAIGSRRYDPLLQRQPGANVAVNISLVPAKGLSLFPASPNERVSLGHVIWTATPLRADTTVSAQLRGTG